MNIKEFWMDIMRTSAIVGVVMAFMNIIKQYLLAFSSMSLVDASVVILIESLVSIVLFVGMVYYFTRRVAKSWNEQIEVSGQVFNVKFSYAGALSYILTTTMFAGIIVGVANTIYVDVMGYDLYISGVVGRYDEMANLVAGYTELAGEEGMQAQFSELANQQIELIEASEKPSMFANIMSYVSTYMTYGGIVGLVVAALARRKVKN